jgi:hypothetical protein
MPVGTFDLSYLPAAIASPALPIGVLLYQPGQTPPYTILPNIRCMRIDYKEGPEPPVARFVYMMDDTLYQVLGWPSQFEQIWPIDALGPYIVHTDDRLVVATQDPDGNLIVLFDGFAQVPQGDLSAARQGVTFVATGTPVRWWDSPITGRTQRNADMLDVTDGSQDVETELPTRWNPSDTAVGTLSGYLANAVTAEQLTVGQNGNYPVFVDPLVIESDDGGFVQDAAYWFVSDATKYLMQLYPPGSDGASNPYVILPSFKTLDSILNAQYPPTPTGPFDPATAHTADVMIRDYDATNKHVPEVMNDLLEYSGFVMNWLVGQDQNSLPTTTLQLLRRDAAASANPKVVYLAADGVTTFDPSQNNTAAFHLARDNNAVVNAITVEAELNQVEATFYLVPLFQPAAGDQNNTQNFFSTNLTTATQDQRRKYRWYGVDELGFGFWNSTSQQWTTGEGCDFSPLFPKISGFAQYVKRMRPGSKTLISRDASGHPLKAILEIQLGVTSSTPGPVTSFVAPSWPGWQTVSHGWRLLPDRLGIEVTAENPDQWHSGNPHIQDIRGIAWQISGGAQTFALRLTTVIEGDVRITANAPKRIGSPSVYTRERAIDAKDHFRYCEVSPNSLYYSQDGGNGTDPYVVRDDTATAQTHANLVRAAHEFPRLAGSVTIPFLTDYYCIGDRIKLIEGRNANLQINVGMDQGEKPTYPWVTAFSWVLEADRQQTILQLSDRRGEVRPNW